MRTTCSPITLGGRTHFQLDCTAPEGVEVVISKDGRVWVNADGICLLRICRAPDIFLCDNRQLPLPITNK